MNDFDVSIFVVTKNNETVFIDEYDIEDGIVLFVGLTNDNLNSDYGEDNTIYISIDYMNQYNRVDKMLDKWQKEDRYIPNVFSYGKSINLSFAISDIEQSSREMTRIDLNGYKQTNDIMLNVEELLKDYNSTHPFITKNRYIPAIMLAYNHCVVYNKKRIHGYLPAIGQLVYVSENIIMMRDKLCSKNIIDRNKFWINTKEKSDIISRRGMSYKWWSSTQLEMRYGFDLEYVWVLREGYVSCSLRNKTDNGYILPLYKLS